MTRITLIRHGETIDNQKGRFSGFTDSILSERGISEATELKEILKEESFDIIYSSPLSRAKTTAMISLEVEESKIVMLEGLKEMNFGKFEGWKFAEIKEKEKDEYDKIMLGDYSYTFPAGESLISFHDRIKEVIYSILNENPNSNIAIFAHSGVIRAVVSEMVSKTYKSHWNFQIDNCSLTTFRYQDEFAVFEKINYK